MPAFCFMQDGEVDAEELQRCLTQSGFSGSYSRKFGLSVHCAQQNQSHWSDVTESVQSELLPVQLLTCLWCLQRSAWTRAGSWSRCLMYPLCISRVTTLWPDCDTHCYNVRPDVNLNQTVTRGTSQARWASMSSRSCSRLWTAGSRTSWCLTRTEVEPLNLRRWTRHSMPWVRLISSWSKNVNLRDKMKCQAFTKKKTWISSKSTLWHEHCHSFKVIHGACVYQTSQNPFWESVYFRKFPKLTFIRTPVRSEGDADVQSLWRRLRDLLVYSTGWHFYVWNIFNKYTFEFILTKHCLHP